ncbi:MAG: hypothetical protein DSZ28_06400 [Thiothrix sp.]|nr:MAG: hypothetical protein DSZ28_06400 [Thiothrix sp.]
MKKLDGFLSVDLRHKVQQLERYDSILKSFLATPLLEHVAVTRIHANKLYLLTDTQTWASNLQYYKKDLAKRFSAELGLSIQSVVIKIDTGKVIERKEQKNAKADLGKEINPHRIRLRKLLKEL